MSKQLLTDVMPVRFSVTEASEGKLKFRGEFARADVPTANRRLYPESVWSKNLARLDKDIKENKVLGECDHPADGKTKLQRVSHIITSLQLNKDGVLIGEGTIIENTPNGQILKALIEAGATIGVSSRGYGSTKMNESGHDVVQDDFVLLTFDVVCDPANASSYPEFTTESKEKEMKNKKQVSEKKECAEVALENKEKEDKKPEEKKESLADVSPWENEVEGMLADLKFYLSKEKDSKDASKMQKALDALKIVKDIFSEKEPIEEQESVVHAGSFTHSKEGHVPYKILRSQKNGKNVFIPEIKGKKSEKEFDNLESAKSDVLNNWSMKEEAWNAIQSERDQLESVAKELGYRLYLERALKNHPKFDEIVASLGKLSQVESLDKIKELVSVHEDDAKNYNKQKVLAIEINESKLNTRIKELEHQFSELLKEHKAQVKKFEESTVKLNSIIEERESDLKIIQSAYKEEKARALLERKLQLRPLAAARVRKIWEATKLYEEKAIDMLIESMESVVSQDKKLVESVQHSLKKRAKVESIVENSLEGTTIEDYKKANIKERQESVPGLVEQSLSEFARLAGLNEAK